jgi:hypothetical protein
MSQNLPVLAMSVDGTPHRASIIFLRPCSFVPSESVHIEVKLEQTLPLSTSAFETIRSSDQGAGCIAPIYLTDPSAVERRAAMPLPAPRLARFIAAP